MPGFVREQSFDGSVARKVFKNEAEFAAVGVDIAEVWTTQLDRSKESVAQMLVAAKVGRRFFWRSRSSTFFRSWRFVLSNPNVFG